MISKRWAIIKDINENKIVGNKKVLMKKLYLLYPKLSKH